MKKIITWIKEHKVEFVLLLTVILVGAFLRLYRIDEYLTFLGDEGRDVMIIRRLLVEADPILIGPGTSIGNMYLGPLYYYLVAPALFVANYSPVGPAVEIALFGIVTIFMVWYIFREWFAREDKLVNWGAVITAFLYAVSPTVITYSRSSWNPNIMPFFALLTIYSIWKVWKDRKYRWFWLLGFSFAFTMQSHYLALLLIPVFGIYGLISLIRIWKDKAEVKSFIKHALIGLAIFAFLMSSLLIFDMRHGWMNFNSIKKFFTVRQETVSIKPWKAIPNLWPIFTEATTRIVGGRENLAGMWSSIVIVISLIYFLIKKRSASFLLVVCWLGLAVVGLGLYKQEIYDHYYGFFYPAPFMVLGLAANYLIERKEKILGIVVIAGVIFLGYVSLRNNPLKYPPNRQMQRSIEVAKKIELESEGEEFNLAVLAERNYEDGYQYFLEKDYAKVVEIDPQRPETVVGQLYVVCELPKEKCNPVNSPKAEVANFGWSKIENSWEVGGILLYKLIHTQ